MSYINRTPTSEKLAQALESLQDPRLTKMIEQARAGYYDDYKSPLATPLVQLVADLRAFDLEAMAQLVIDGEFDAQGWESDEWAKSPEGQAVFQSLVNPMPAADPEKVRPLLDHLFKAYAEYCNDLAESDDGLQWPDAFMVAHNFHCWVLQDLERQVEMDPKRQLSFRKMAIDTFRQSLERRP